MPDSKVYATSFFCERLLTEKDNAMSAIRLSDTWHFALRPDNTPTAVALIETNFVTLLKCETAKQFTAKVVGTRPDGSVFGREEFPVSLPGGIAGHVIVMPMLFQVSVFGLHWMEVFVDEEMIQKTPLLAKLDPAAETPGQDLSGS